MSEETDDSLEVSPPGVLVRALVMDTALAGIGIYLVVFGRSGFVQVIGVGTVLVFGTLLALTLVALAGHAWRALSDKNDGHPPNGN